MATLPFRARLRDQSGQILVLTSVSMVALLGVAALALDASFMTAKRNRMHSAADAAAKSAAIELVRNSAVTQAALEAFADQQVAAHGLTPTRQSGTTSVIINRPPTTGAFAGNASYVEAIVSEPTSMFFGRILGWASMTPGAISVAGAGNPSNCLIINEDMGIGNMTVTLNGCGAGIGGNLAGNNPNSTITGSPTPPVGVSGTCTGTCTSMGALATGAPAPTDPLAGLAAPTAPDPVTCVPGSGTTLNAGCYTSIPASVTTLNPGIYYVTGTVNIDNLTGSGVMIYLTGAGQLDGENNSSLNLTAPTSGPYTGIAIFQDKLNTSEFKLKNQFTLNVSGAIYMPGVDVDFKNTVSFTNTNCTLFIAKSLKIKNGNGALSNSGCAATFGGAIFLNASIAQ
jgi:Flp pilus assembly protein TadG